MSGVSKPKPKPTKTILKSDEAQTKKLVSAPSFADSTLAQLMKKAMERYLDHLGEDTSATNVYDVILAQVEKPLFESVMTHLKGNQCKVAVFLGISRGTLRKKLKLYGLEGL